MGVGASIALLAMAMIVGSGVLRPHAALAATGTCSILLARVHVRRVSRSTSPSHEAGGTDAASANIRVDEQPLLRSGNETTVPVGIHWQRRSRHRYASTPAQLASLANDVDLSLVNQGGGNGCTIGSPDTAVLARAQRQRLRSSPMYQPAQWRGGHIRDDHRDWIYWDNLRRLSNGRGLQRSVIRQRLHGHCDIDFGARASGKRHGATSRSRTRAAPVPITSADLFTYTTSQPTITAVTPSSGGVGSTVTITGTNLNTTSCIGGGIHFGLVAVTSCGGIVVTASSITGVVVPSGQARCT